MRAVVKVQKGVASVAVADTGVGIDPDDVPHLFDRFYRADPSRSRRTGGSGLGLASVKHLIEAHSGTIMVSSELGRGSTFTIELPLSARTGSPADPAIDSGAPPSSAQQDPRVAGSTVTGCESHPMLSTGEQTL